MSEVKAVYINHGKVIGGAPSQLDNLSDVSITSPGADQVLSYDATTGVWSNKTVPSPEGKADKVDGATNGDLAALDATGNLTDSGVKLNVSSPTAGQALTYDATNEVFVNSDIPSPEGKADKVDGATEGNLAGLDSTGNLTDSGIAADDVVVKSDTTGLIKNDGSIDTNAYLTSTDISTMVTVSDTTGLIKNDGTIDENVYLIAADISNVITVSDTTGLVKNDGSIDTNTYLTSTDISTMVTVSDTTGLIKNDGTIDTNQYLTEHQDISGKADKVDGATDGDLAALDSNGNLSDSGVKLNITSPTSGQALMYDTTNSVWTNQSVPSPEGKADKVDGAVNGDIAGLDSNGNLTDSGIAATDIIVKSATAGLVKNDGTIDTNTYLTSTDISTMVTTSDTTGLIKNDGTIDTNQYLVSNDISNVIVVSDTAGLVKNDGTIDTNTYLTSTDISTMVTTSDTTGLIKNDGTIDTNQYLTQHQDISGKADKVENATSGDVVVLDSNGNIVDSNIASVNVLVKSATAGLVKNDGTIDTNDYLTASDISDKADKVTNATNGDLATLDGNGNLVDSNIAAANIVVKSDTTGLIKNDGTIDTNSYVQTSEVGTAAAKNSTNVVSADSTSLVESGAVKDAIDSAISRVYKPSGNKTVAQLVSSLLIESNNGNVYNMTDSGVTTSDFMEGAGHPINIGDNIAIVKDPDEVGDVYKFDILSGFADMSNYVVKSATAGLIKNDGTIDTNTYLTSTDISNVITVSATAGLVKNDGSIDTNQYLTEHQDISGKADKVANATAGDVVTLDSNGNIVDSGIDSANVILKAVTSGLIKNDGTIDTNTYLTATDISGKADKVDSATSGDVVTLDANGNIVDSGIASTDVIIKSATAGLVKNDGTIDTNTYLTSTDISTMVTTSSTEGLIKNDGSIDTNQYLVSNDISNVIVVSDTTGLVKNDGTIDTNTYLTSTDISTMVTTSDTTGLIKNDGTIDENVYLVAADISNVITISDTTGLVKNDGTIDENTYLVAADISNVIVVSDTAGLVKNDGTIDTNTYLTSTDISTMVTVSDTTGLIKNDGTIDTNSYLVSNDISNVVTVSDTTGLIKNDGTIDTNSYLTSTDISTMVTTSDTTGLIKNDGSIDTNTYLTSTDISTMVTVSDTTGLIKNDGTIDTNQYLTSNDITTKANLVTDTIVGNIAGIDATTGNYTDSGISIDISSPTAGQVLLYDTTNSVWSNNDIPSDPTKADKATEITYEEYMEMTEEERLAGIWIVTGYPGAEGAGTLADLEDTNISNPVAGQAIVYDSTNRVWINGAVAATLPELGDVQLTLPLVDGQVLVYSATIGKWVNGNPSDKTVTAQFEVSPATKAHAVNTYINYNGTTYKVKAAIAIGDTLTVGTNIEVPNFEDGTVIYIY